MTALLAELALRLTCLATPRRGETRERLMELVTLINAGQADVAPPLRLDDANALVQAYVQAGGQWHDLVVAVNRQGLAGGGRRAAG